MPRDHQRPRSDTQCTARHSVSHGPRGQRLSAANADPSLLTAPSNDRRVYNPSIFDLGLTRADVSATLKGHGDRVSPQRTADATARAGAVAGCVLADSDESHHLPSKGWASVSFYCEVALVNATGESLKLLISNDSVTLELGYSAAGNVAGLPATRDGFFEYTAGGDSDFRDVVDDDDEEEACSVDDLTKMVLDPLREAAQVELCELRVCTGGLAAIETDGGAACAASLEAYADETGTLALAVGIQVYNPTTVRLRITALHLAISLDGIAPTPASTQLATVQQAGALAGCELDSAVTMPALAWGVLNATCELRLGDETGVMLSALLDNRTIELWAGYSIDAEVVGVTLQNEGTLGRNWSLAQVTGPIAGGSRAATIAAPDCGDPFAEVDAMLKLPLINLTKCGTNTSDAFDGLIEQVAGLLGTGNVMNALNCREMRPALIELCTGLRASESGIGDGLQCPCEASDSASFLSASALGLALQVIQCSITSGGRRLDGLRRRLDQASCDELTASVLRSELSIREEFDLHNPSPLNITLDATITFRDAYGRLVGTAEAVKFSVRGPATETVVVDIDVRSALARAIVDEAQMRWIMCLIAEPNQPRPECDNMSEDLTADVSLVVEWLDTSVIVPIEPVVVKASSFFAPSTNCSCFVGSDDKCLEDISGLTLASMYEED